MLLEWGLVRARGEELIVALDGAAPASRASSFCARLNADPSFAAFDTARQLEGLSVGQRIYLELVPGDDGYCSAQRLSLSGADKSSSAFYMAVTYRGAVRLPEGAARRYALEAEPPLLLFCPPAAAERAVETAAGAAAPAVILRVYEGKALPVGIMTEDGSIITEG